MEPLQNTTFSPADEATISQETFVQTGKRVRKKNPRYDDMIQLEKDKKRHKKTGRPKKRKKLNPQPDKDVFVLAEKKKSLENELSLVKNELRSIRKDLHNAHVQAGIPLPSDLAHYDELDDAEEMDTSTDTPYEPPGTKKRTSKVTKKSKGKRGSTKIVATKPKVAPVVNKEIQPPSKVVRPKRSKIPAEPVITNEFLPCRTVLSQLMNHRYALPFNIPVDPEALGIPDYPLVITHPMDFGTVRSKLNSSSYATVDDFISDVELIFHNACTYNSPSSDVFAMAESLRKLFADKKRFLLAKSGKDDTPSRNLRGSQSSRDRGETSPIAPRRVKKDVISKPLTKEEKQRLSVGIKGLHGSQLAVVVQIIKEKLPDLSSDKEIVIDIDSLDTVTLRSLQKFVSSTNRKKKKPSKRRVSHIDPAARLELVKLTELGMQSKIETVRRQLQELSSTKNPSSPVPAKVAHYSEVLTPLEPSPVPIMEQENSQVRTSDVSGSEGESDSESEDSDSDSGSDIDTGSILEPTVQTVVETVVAPVLQNIPIQANAPRIIATSPIASEVKADNIENVASWAQLASQDGPSGAKASNPVQSEATNLWSSIRDSHAQLKQKEQEQILHKERLQKEKEAQEAELLRLAEEKMQKVKEAAEEKIRQQEEAKLKAEQDIEEARQKAKRDRKQKVEADKNESSDIYSAFGGMSIPTGNGASLTKKLLSDVNFSDIRSSLQNPPANGPSAEPTPPTT